MEQWNLIDHFSQNERNVIENGVNGMRMGAGLSSTESTFAVVLNFHTILFEMNAICIVAMRLKLICLQS